MLQSFVSATAKSYADLGSPRALTGPAIREDWATISRHIEALREADPDAVSLYRELTRRMLALTGQNTASVDRLPSIDD